MTQHSSTDVAVTVDPTTPASAKVKRIAQMAGAAALSVGLVGTFSLPAYATAPEVAGMPDGFANSQSLETVAFDDTILPLSAPDAQVGEDILAEEAAAEAKAAEEKAAAEAAALAATTASAATAAPTSAPTGTDIPAGAGAQGIVSAALAQLGVFQDCTALVENALRAVGYPAGDLGTQIYEYTALGGYLVSSGDYAPGDVLIWSGRHVAVYIGNGQAVHGGYGGNQTVVASAFLDGAPSGVVRFG